MQRFACVTVSLGVTRICMTVFSCLLSLGVSEGGIIAFSSDFESGLSGSITGSASIVSVEGLQGKGNAGNTFWRDLQQNLVLGARQAFRIAVGLHARTGDRGALAAAVVCAAQTGAGAPEAGAQGTEMMVSPST